MTERTIGGVSCARNEQENRRSRYQKCEQQRIRHDAQNREKKQKWVQRKLLRTIFLSRRTDEKEKGGNFENGTSSEILVEKIGSKGEKEFIHLHVCILLFQVTFIFSSYCYVFFFFGIHQCHQIDIVIY